MMGLMRRRIEAEWAQVHLNSIPGFVDEDDTTGKESKVVRPSLEAFRERVNSMATIRDDLAYVNREIDTYK